MRKTKQVLSVSVLIILTVLFFRQTIWFWINNPEMTQMQVAIEKWPYFVLFILAIPFMMWLNLDKEN